jgi:hypothetical protein
MSCLLFVLSRLVLREGCPVPDSPPSPRFSRLSFLIDSRTLKFKKKFNFVPSFSPEVKKP